MFLPGAFSSDSVDQLRQATGQLRLTTWHPISMAVYWRFLLTLTGGEVAMLALMRITVFWLGIFLISVFVYRKTRSKRLALLPVIVGVLPNVLVVLHYNWKDSEMASYLLLALGIILNIGLIKPAARHYRFIKSGLLIMSFALIVYAMSVRTNAVIAAIPILVLWADQIFGAERRNKLRLFYYAGVVVIALLTTLLVGRILTGYFRPAVESANTTMYSLDIVNILPKDQIEKLEVSNSSKALLMGMASGDCSRFNRGWSVVVWFDACLSKDLVPYLHDGTVAKELQATWLRVIVANPVAFTAYSAVTYMNWLTSDAPMVSYFGDYHLSDRVISPKSSYGQRFFQIYNNNFGNKWMDLLYEKWFYLVLDSVLLVIAFRNKLLKNRRIILAILTSSLLYILSFGPAALTPDYRYILWTVISSFVALVLILAEVDWQNTKKVIRFKAS